MCEKSYNAHYCVNYVNCIKQWMLLVRNESNHVLSHIINARELIPNLGFEIFLEIVIICNKYIK